VKQFVTLPNVITSGNMAAGFLALLLVMQSAFFQVALLVILASAFDILDGAMARRNPTNDTFGANLDSLADLISFGAVPAVALYLDTLHILPGTVALAVCLGYFLCGAWRLARFPLLKDINHSVGLPIPVAGVLTALIAASSLPASVSLTVVLVLSVLMTSTLTFPRFCSLHALKQLLQDTTEARRIL
jgi:CDP-diacylglycerol--serine O-phosphatidyltransferase